MSNACPNTLPQAQLQFIDPASNGLVQVDAQRLFADKQLVLFGVPGAFTPVCSQTHLPDYIAAFSKFSAQNIMVACVSVNDPFVMQAWAQSQNVPADLLMLADSDATFTKALGLAMDASAYGMGVRSKRYALFAENTQIQALFVDEADQYRLSSPAHMLNWLSQRPVQS